MIRKKLGGVVLVGFFVFSTVGNAADCFQFESRLSRPERTTEFQIRNEAPSTWCYETVDTDSGSMRYVYNIDAGKVRVELAALVEIDSAERVLSVTHGMLDRGSLSIRRIADASLSPMGVPLLESEARFTAVSVKRGFETNVEISAQQVLEKLLLAQANEAPMRVSLAEGNFESSVPADKLPWRGFWWGRGTLDTAPDAPLVVYDSIAQKWTGTDPRSRVWEVENHDKSMVDWAGHCNGWAASSVLYAEPTRALWEASTGRVIYPGQIKGLLAETNFCVQWAFYGQRYWGEAGDRLEDIDPDLFHKVLVYYINDLKKPVAVDYHRDAAVDNHVITGYRFNISKISAREFAVQAVINISKYDEAYDRNGIGKAERYTRQYAYTLTTDANGEISGGRWTGGDNPDFLWVPLAQERCGWENPSVDQNIVDRIIKLPAAQQLAVALDFKLGRVLSAGEVVHVPVSETRGESYVVEITGNDGGSIDLTAAFEGVERTIRVQGSGEFSLGEGRNLKSLTIKNVLGSATDVLQLKQLKFLGGRSVSQN